MSKYPKMNQQRRALNLNSGRELLMEKIHVKAMLSWLINDNSSSSQAKITSTSCALRDGQSMLAFGPTGENTAQ
jgi:hypothetical protein